MDASFKPLLQSAKALSEELNVVTKTTAQKKNKFKYFWTGGEVKPVERSRVPFFGKWITSRRVKNVKSQGFEKFDTHVRKQFDELQVKFQELEGTLNDKLKDTPIDQLEENLRENFKSFNFFILEINRTIESETFSSGVGNPKKVKQIKQKALEINKFIETEERKLFNQFSKYRHLREMDEKGSESESGFIEKIHPDTNSPFHKDDLESVQGYLSNKGDIYLEMESSKKHLGNLYERTKEEVFDDDFKTIITSLSSIFEKNQSDIKEIPNVFTSLTKDPDRFIDKVHDLKGRVEAQEKLLTTLQEIQNRASKISSEEISTEEELKGEVSLEDLEHVVPKAFDGIVGFDKIIEDLSKNLNDSKSELTKLMAAIGENREIVEGKIAAINGKIQNKQDLVRSAEAEEQKLLKEQEVQEEQYTQSSVSARESFLVLSIPKTFPDGGPRGVNLQHALQTLQDVSNGEISLDDAHDKLNNTDVFSQLSEAQVAKPDELLGGEEIGKRVDEIHKKLDSDVERLRKEILEGNKKIMEGERKISGMDESSDKNVPGLLSTERRGKKFVEFVESKEVQKSKIKEKTTELEKITDSLEPRAKFVLEKLSKSLLQKDKLRAGSINKDTITSEDLERISEEELKKVRGENEEGTIQDLIEERDRLREELKQLQKTFNSTEFAKPEDAEKHYKDDVLAFLDLYAKQLEFGKGITGENITERDFENKIKILQKEGKPKEKEVKFLQEIILIVKPLIEERNLYRGFLINKEIKESGVKFDLKKLQSEVEETREKLEKLTSQCSEVEKALKFYTDLQKSITHFQTQVQSKRKAERLETEMKQIRESNEILEKETVKLRLQEAKFSEFLQELSS